LMIQLCIALIIILITWAWGKNIYPGTDYNYLSLFVVVLLPNVCATTIGSFLKGKQRMSKLAIYQVFDISLQICALVTFPEYFVNLHRLIYLILISKTASVVLA